jgi:hypothetical protein
MPRNSQDRSDEIRTWALARAVVPKPPKRKPPTPEQRQKQNAAARIARAEGRYKERTPEEYAINRAQEKARQQTPEFKDKAAQKYKLKREAMADRPRPLTCEVCELVPRWSGRNSVLYWDHCHTSKRFRGWICHGCNIALGGVGDSPAILRKLADYLEGHR